MSNEPTLEIELRLLADLHAYGAVRSAMLRAADEIELLKVEGTPESRAELDDALAQVVELRAIIERVSSTDDVAKAYQQVYFEDERNWRDERTKRIEAEVTVDNLNTALTAWRASVDGQIPRLRNALIDLATVAVEVDPSIATRVAPETGRVIEELWGHR